MLGAVILVLLIACVNVMNMQFGRAGVARQRTGDSRCARRDSLAAGPANVDRKSRSCGPRRSRRSSPRLLGGRLLVARTSASALSTALLDSIHDRRARPRIHGRFTLLATLVSGLVPGLSECARQCRRNDERRRSRQQQPTGQYDYAHPRGRPNCVDRGAVDCGDAADQVDPQSDSSSTTVTMKTRFTPRAWPCWKALTRLRTRRRNFSTGRARIARESAVRRRGDERPLSHDVRRRRPVRSGRPNLSDRSRPAARQFRVGLRRLFLARSGLKILEGRDFTIDDSDAKQPVAIVNASLRASIGAMRARLVVRSGFSIPASRSRGARSSAWCRTR